jgi:hypothetical protein
MRGEVRSRAPWIERKRLKALPIATRCISCAASIAVVKTDVAHGQGHKPSSDHQRSDRPAVILVFSCCTSSDLPETSRLQLLPRQTLMQEALTFSSQANSRRSMEAVQF